MLIDFCHHSVKSKIKCDKVSFDGYEVSNLVSEDPQLKARGFMVEHFIKPPVNITLMFPCNVSIYRIVVNPVIGQQQSCDFKIFTASSVMTKSWLYQNDNCEPLNTDGILFNYVGSVSQQVPQLLCLENQQFRERRFWTKDQMLDLSCFPVTGELRSRKPCALHNVSHVTLNVLRAKDGKTVAVKKLEIWGMPSVKVQYNIQDLLKSTYVNSVFSSLKTKSESLRGSDISATNDRTKSVKDEASYTAMPEASTETNSELDVPEEFLDQLTFEIMSVPMLLPSGKNIDLSTLEKFVNSEASWGRPPSDPFTGVPFTQTQHAITNLGLKARLDQFILRNIDGLKNIPRTLSYRGSGANKVKSFQLSSLSRPALQEPSSEQALKRKADDWSTDQAGKVPKISHSKYCVSTSPPFDFMETPAKKSCIEICASGRIDSKIEEFLNTKSGPSALSSGIRHSGEKTKSGSEVSVGSQNSQKKSCYTERNHSDELSRSLNDALASTLGSLPSFTSKKQSRNSPGNQQVTSALLCVSCNVDCNQEDIVKYRLPCNHHMCRSCSTQQVGGVTCNTCSRTFKSCEIVRVF